MRRRLRTWAGVCALAAGLALALSSCGSDSPTASAKAKTTPISAPAEGPANENGAPPKKAAPASCLSQFDDLLKAMGSLRQRLVTGLAYEEYVGAVRVIMGAYREIPADEVTLACVRAVGTPAEQALNRYISASNTWTDCVEVPSCEAVSVEAPLQRKWQEASKSLSKAQRGLTEPAAG